MLGVRQWRHGAFFVSRQHRLRRRWPKAQFDVFIHRLWKVYHRWIRNNFPCKWHKSTTSGSKSSPKKIFHRNSSGARTLTSNSAWTTKKEHRLAQRIQRRQQETQEREIGIRGIMIVLHCRKPRFLSLPVSPPIYRSKSVSALYYGPKNNNFQANCTRPCICSLFLSFSKSGRRNNAKSAFQYTVNNNTTQYEKKKKKKERTKDFIKNWIIG